MENSIEDIRREARQSEQRAYLRNSALILNALRERFGDEVAAVVEKAVCEQTIREVKELAKSRESHTAEDLVGMLFGADTHKTHNFTISREPDGIHVKITKCPVAELGRELDMSEWMYHLDCCKDGVIAGSFNPALRCRCVKTLTRGDDCCYQIYSEEPQEGRAGV